MSISKKQKQTVAKLKNAVARGQKRVGKRAKAANDATRFTTVLGEYGTKVEAEREALNYRHPDVFTYQSAIFPNPKNFGVSVTVAASKVVNRDVAPSNRGTTVARLVPFAVELSMAVSGQADRVNNWIEAFKARSRQAVY